MTKKETEALRLENVEALNRLTSINLLISRQNCDVNGNPIFHICFIRPLTGGSAFLCTVFKGIVTHGKIKEDYVRLQDWRNATQVANDFEAILRTAGVTTPINWFATRD